MIYKKGKAFLKFIFLFLLFLNVSFCEKMDFKRIAKIKTELIEEGAVYAIVEGIITDVGEKGISERLLNDFLIRSQEYLSWLSEGDIPEGQERTDINDWFWLSRCCWFSCSNVFCSFGFENPCLGSFAWK